MFELLTPVKIARYSDPAEMMGIYDVETFVSKDYEPLQTQEEEESMRVYSEESLTKWQDKKKQFQKIYKKDQVKGQLKYEINPID